MINIKNTLLNFILCFFLSFFLAPNLSFAQENSTQNTESDEVIGELWTGSIYTSTFRAGACFSDDGKVQGVLHLKLQNGQIDTYHFYGTMDRDGVIDAAHRSGYRFVGRFESDTKISGKAMLTNGFSTKLRGDRFQNVKLTKRCGPLPE